MIYYVYILECQGGRYYTGYTTDLERRYKEHQHGSPKCKFTRSFPPIRIAAFWQLGSKSEALKLEKYIKKLTKTQKISLVNGEHLELGSVEP